MRSLRVHESRRSDDSMSGMAKVALKSSGTLTLLSLYHLPGRVIQFLCQECLYISLTPYRDMSFCLLRNLFICAFP